MIYNFLEILIRNKIFSKGSQNYKKIRTDVAVELTEDNCLLSAMKALSSDQLISIIGQIVVDHPSIEKVYNIIDIIKK